MTTRFFTVFDSAAGLYLEPFSAPTAEVAIRGFRQAVNKADHQFNLYPDDYTLFEIGSFDPESGEIMGITPHSLGNALTFLARPTLTATGTDNV